MKLLTKILIFYALVNTGCNTAKTTKVYYEVGALPNYSVDRILNEEAIKAHIHCSKKVDDGLDHSVHIVPRPR